MGIKKLSCMEGHATESVICGIVLFNLDILTILDFYIILFVCHIILNYNVFGIFKKHCYVLVGVEYIVANDDVFVEEGRTFACLGAQCDARGAVGACYVAAACDVVLLDNDILGGGTLAPAKLGTEFDGCLGAVEDAVSCNNDVAALDEERACKMAVYRVVVDAYFGETCVVPHVAAFELLGLDGSVEADDYLPVYRRGVDALHCVASLLGHALVVDDDHCVANFGVVERECVKVGPLDSDFNLVVALGVHAVVVTVDVGAVVALSLEL